MREKRNRRIGANSGQYKHRYRRRIPISQDQKKCMTRTGSKRKMEGVDVGGENTEKKIRSKCGQEVKRVTRRRVKKRYDAGLTPNGKRQGKEMWGKKRKKGRKRISPVE